MRDANTLNPFVAQAKKQEVLSSEESRAIEEVQAAMVIAKRFPRDQLAAADRILQACTRPRLAEVAMYAYPRGGQSVTGPSIRLAEAIAQNWGNIAFGVRELAQRGGESIVEAFAWDLETNTKQVKVFQVKHLRKAKGAVQKLEDPRDIYELVANQGARRLRACILGIVPGDIVESAVQQCEVTLANSSGVPAEEIKKLVSAFAEIGISGEQLRKRLGHNLDATISAEIISLRKIYTSLRDGMSRVTDWFGEVKEVKKESDAQEEQEKIKREIKEKLGEPK